MIWMAAFWHLVGLLTGNDALAGLFAHAGMAAGVVADAGTAAGILLAIAVALYLVHRPRTTRARVRGIRRVVREWARRTGVPRHRDPDASGRSRPRAPAATTAVA